MKEKEEAIFFGLAQGHYLLQAFLDALLHLWLEHITSLSEPQTW